MSRRYSRSMRSQNRTSMFLIMTVVCMLLAVVSYHSITLREKLEDYKKVEAELLLEIEAEEERAIEIAEYEKYTQTMMYIEEVAKSKLGLVYADEIIFKSE